MLNNSKTVQNLLKENTKSVSIIIGSIITVFLISQFNWAYDHNDFSDIVLRIVLASIIGTGVGALYILSFPPIVQKAIHLDRVEVINRLSIIHAPVYLFWFYLINIQFGIGFLNKYLVFIIPIFCLLSIRVFFKKYPLDSKIYRQIPYIEISIFSSIIAITLAYFFYQALLGLSGNALTGIIKTLGFSLLLLNLPYNISVFFKYKSHEARLPWYQCQSLTTILILFLITLVGFVIQDNNYCLDYILSTAGYIFFLLTLWRYIYVNIISRKTIRNTLFLSAFFAFSLWVTAIVGSSNHTGPFYMKKIYLGLAGIDTIFHASISHMIQTYGIPSTGIDGLPYIHYHWGSHWIFAQLSKLIQINPFHFYELCYPVIFVSLFFYSILLFIVKLRNFYHIPEDSEQTLFRCHTFIIFAAAFISFLPLHISRAMCVGVDSCLISQSYLVSVTICFLFLCVIISFWKNFNVTKQINKIDLTLLYFIIPFLIACIGLSKISIMFIIFAVATYLFIRLGLYKYNHFILSYILSTLIFLIVSYYTMPKMAHGFSITPFHFIKTYIADPWKPFHSAFFYFWSFLFVYLTMQMNGISNGNLFKNAFFNRTTIGIEIIIIISIIGFLPGALIPIPGGGAYYFSSFQIWVSLSFLIALLTQCSLRLKPGTIVFILFLMPFIYTIYHNGKVQFLEYRIQANTLKNQSVDTTSKEYQILNILENLNKLPLSQKRNSLLFIPQNNLAYWNLSHGDTAYRCNYVPFIAPALSGIGMIDGLPTVNCNAKYYGYGDYKIRAEEQTDMDRTKNCLCSKALEKGFNNIIRIDQNEEGFQQTNIKCK